jgi:hypothetical protein
MILSQWQRKPALGRAGCFPRYPGITSQVFLIHEQFLDLGAAGSVPGARAAEQAR